MSWEDWKERNAWWWNFATTPILVVGVAVLIVIKWYWRARAALRR